MEKEKRDWIFLGFFGSTIGFLVYLFLNVACGTYSVTTPLYAFGCSLGYFITFSTVGYYFFVAKKKKHSTNFFP